MTAIEEMQVITRKETLILNVAERFFATKGFDSTSVRDIAREVGMSVSMISYYFGSKEKLMEAIILKRLGLMKLRLEKLLDDYSLSSLDKMYTVVETTVSDMTERQYFQQILIREQCGKAGTVTGRLIEDNREVIAELMEALVNQGQNKGEFKKDVDIVLLMMTLVGTTNHLMAAEQYYRSKHDMQNATPQQFQKHITAHVTNYLKDIFRHVLCD